METVSGKFSEARTSRSKAQKFLTYTQQRIRCLYGVYKWINDTRMSYMYIPVKLAYLLTYL